MRKCFTAKVAMLALVCILLVLVYLPAGAVPEPGETDGSRTMSPDTPVSERFGVGSSMLFHHAPVNAVYPADGTNMHREFDAMQAAGIKWVRCNFVWNEMEPGSTEGNWGFDGRDLGGGLHPNPDLVVDLAQAHGVRVLGILAGTPAWANGNNWASVPPTNPTGPGGTPDPKLMEAWREYVTTVCSRYKGRVDAWEIWNEENTLNTWLLTQPPNPTLDQYVDSYVQLLELTWQAIRSVDPQVKIVMGGVAGLGRDPLEPQGDADYYYLEACLQRGAAAYLDAIAYHPYGEVCGWSHPEESRCRSIVQDLRQLISEYSPGKPLEIWVTEFGWRGYDAGTKASQAKYLLRDLINYADTTVAAPDMVFSYKLWDEGGVPEEYFGLLNNDFSAKPAFNYYKCFEQVFGPTVSFVPDYLEFSCSRPETLEAHFFQRKDGSIALAFWKTDGSSDTLALNLNRPNLEDPLLVDPATGGSSPIPGTSRDPNGNIVVPNLPVGDTPVIITAKTLDPATCVYAVTPFYAFRDSQVSAEIRGSGFVSGAAVRLEGSGSVIDAYGVQVISPESITCGFNLAGAPLERYDLVVSNPGGGEARLQCGFSVLPPLFNVTSVTPSSGASGSTVSITNLKGAGFLQGATVKLEKDGSLINATGVSVISSFKITCNFNLGGAQTGAYYLVVSNPGGAEARLKCFNVAAAAPPPCGSGGIMAMVMMGMLCLVGTGGLLISGLARRGSEERR